jgi:GntR family transcriptional regulator, rspAB operon transcriptional repressor
MHLFLDADQRPMRKAPPDVYADLRLKIMSLALPPGSHLSRVDLQDTYRVSSTPIRDALLRLQEEGLVDIFPQSRTVVTRIDLALAHEAHFLRTSLEQSVVRRVTENPDPHLLETLRHILKLQSSSEAQQAFQPFSHLDQAFHRALFRAAGHERLCDVIRRESIHIDRLRALHLPIGDKTARIVREHGEIVDAIGEGSSEKAVAAMAHHLSQSIAIAGELSQSRPDYFKR